MLGPGMPPRSSKINESNQDPQLKLSPRLTKVLDFLTKNAPKRYSVRQIAKAIDYSPATLSNEMPILLSHDLIIRSISGKVFQYYVGNPEISATLSIKGLEDWGKPVSDLDFLYTCTGVNDPAYTPSPVRLAWKLSWALAQLLGAAVTGDLSQAGAARVAVEEVQEAATSYAMTLSRLLATVDAWDNPQALTEGMPEENLEKLRELASQALDRAAKLLASKQPSQTTKEGL